MLNRVQLPPVNRFTEIRRSNIYRGRKGKCRPQNPKMKTKPQNRNTDFKTEAQDKNQSHKCKYETESGRHHKMSKTESSLDARNTKQTLNTRK